MKSLRIHSYDSQGKVKKSIKALKKKELSFEDRPTPLDFDSFIPWFCLEVQVPKNVIVTRTNQAEYISQNTKLSRVGSCTKSSKWKARSTKIKLTQSEEEKRISKPTKTSFATSTIDLKDAIPVTTCYDKRGRLVEIAIVGCPFPIDRKVIQAFNLCLPFHSELYKLTIRKGGVTHEILHEVSKLLPHSNITEVCLDDTRVPNLNYSILLDRSSQIKYLSLKRCGINEVECKKIASKLELNGPAAKNLLLLDLTSNNISDGGAKALGESLKTNRFLLHLNLSGNNISDTGAAFIFKYLQEFPLAVKDIEGKWYRRLDFLKSRAIIYKKCLEEAKLADIEKKCNKDDVYSNQVKRIMNTRKKTCQSKSIKKYIPSFIIEDISVEDDAENKTREIMGEFEDPFKEEYITRHNNVVSALGNVTLTSLNLAYNNLTNLSIRKILEVLNYQSGINKPTRSTGLIRVVVDGNNIPTPCFELVELDICLKKALMENEHHMTSILSFTNSSALSGK